MSNRRQLDGKNVADSRALVRRGVQGVSARGEIAKERAVVPASTQRALQLRNGKGGSFGTSEVMRIPGREKLELIAEDEMEKAKDEKRKNLYEANMNSSLKAPFRLETILKIAQSQMDAYIDFINALHKSDLCYDIINHEIQAQCPPGKGLKEPDLMRAPSFVAEQFGICVHNAHMLASGWVILYESFRKLQEIGLRDREVLMQLKTDASIRDIYVSAYELLKQLVSAGQQRLRSIVQNTPHYSPYFKSSNDTKDFQEFERSEVKKMYNSFLDSAVIELCLPGSRFSPQALYFCLHTAGKESPRLLRRCPQHMWDAVGDLAEAVRLMDLMETPLITQDFDLKPEENSTIFNEFVRWNEAQAVSIRSATQYSGFVNLVHPLTNLKNKPTLNKTWDRLNASYVRESGQNIDALWQLVDARHRVPHFSTLTVSADLLYKGTENDDKALVLRDRNGKQKPTKTGADGDDGEGSESSMPGLLEVSDSEDDDQESVSLDEDDDSVFSSYNGSGDGDDEYDEDRDQELKRQQREAIDKFLEDPTIADLNSDKYANERKGNPILLLLGNLKGRLFSSGSALRTDGVRPTKASAAKNSTAESSIVPKASDNKPSSSLEQGAPPTKTTMEDADDESDEPKGGDYKKKKKKPKKKKKKTTTEVTESPIVESPSSPVPEPPRTPSPSPDLEVASPTSSTSPKKRKRPAQKSLSIKASSVKSDLSGTTTLASTTTLPLPHEQKAPSAHSYLQRINEGKTKVKTRPDQPVEAPPEKERKNLFDRLRGKDHDDEPNEEGKQKGSNSADVFGRLKRKTGTFARRLFGVTAQDKKGALKWDQFLQVMRELGFDYDPSTAGSSVRFDPPNPNDRSISFHKPHPDPTLHQNMLKQYRDKLEAYYGWSPEKFQKAMEGVEGISSEEEYYWGKEEN